MKYLSYLLSTILLLLPLTISAQESAPASEWEYVLINRADDAYFVVTPNGVTPYYLPDMPHYSQRAIWAISDDRQLASFSGTVTDSDPTTAELSIIDFSTDDGCCVIMESLFSTPSVIGDAFSADNSLLVGLFNAQFGAEEGAISSYAVWDTQTGELLAEQPSRPMPPWIDTRTIQRFDRDILTYQSVDDLAFTTWNLDTNTVNVEDIAGTEQNCVPTDNLTTGEDVGDLRYDTYATSDASYSDWDSRVYRPDNVVVYNRVQGCESTPLQVIYHNPERLILYDTTWVFDGAAVLVRYAPTFSENITTLDTDAVLVYRDGTTESVTVPTDPVAIYGTPTGFFYIQPQPTDNPDQPAGQFVYVTRADDETFIYTDMGTYDNVNILTVRYNTPLGASISNPTFAPYIRNE